MMTRKFNLFIRDIRNSLSGVFNLTRSRVAPGLVSLCSFVISVLVVLSNMGGAGVGDIRNFETGKVADRDVIAGYPVSYIDEEATRIRMEDQERLVPAVFRYSREAGMEARDSWNAFCDFADKLAGNSAAASFRLAIQAEYPAFFSNETIAAYVAAPERAAFRGFGLEALDAVLTRGIFSLNNAEIKNYNSDAVELLNPSGFGTGWEQMPYSNIVTSDNVREALEQTVKDADMPVSFRMIGADLLRPFIKENVFFSPPDSHRRAAEARERVAPVIKYIKKGMKIIRKGFVITADEMQALQALHLSQSEKDPRNVIGLVLLVSLIYVLFIFLRGRLVLGRELNDSESYLLSALACLYLTGAVLVKNISPGGIEGVPAAIVFPTALLVMIPAVFMGSRLALVMALAFPLGAYLSGSFDTTSYIFALISGVAASTVLKDAEKRMDLIKAGLIIAAANCLAVIVILLMRGAGPADYPVMLFWAALNGIISGMLVLGILPPLENALNAVTPFRLMELSDLNAPILRKLFTTAPGTYSHSIMVANLAEQACQDIGADPLLARVGAYYHDIGKMENPSYFVENQTDHNKHDDIAPRLSATVIRSHVKLGVEKARSLGLPKDVISIIAEHHGNSLISWFYNKAVQKEDQVNAEDFSYPGTPPRSRESAVVMLADVTEAAVRTLSKPTAAKMEKFVQQLFSAKVEHGQLAESELTFRDLETIKNAFVRVLAGYYHSRIEYPEQKPDQKKERNGKESREEE
ncbi:MAG: HDIG domain-containing protein [Treponema sp.]|nr:HDIG domain-containing protein [Treponema sp.]